MRFYWTMVMMLEDVEEILVEVVSYDSWMMVVVVEELEGLMVQVISLHFTERCWWW